jgi:carboxymethylenebutenolidase
MTALIERQIAIPTPSGSMEMFVARPAGSVSPPLVIVFMDVWGFRPQLFEIASRIASMGYCSVVPSFYYREGFKGVDFRDARGQTLSMEVLPKEQGDVVRSHGMALTNAMVDADVGAVLKFFENEPVSQGTVGSVGFCMGGRHAMFVAGTRPERMVATASLHGTRLVSDKPDSPHRMAERFRGEMYFGFAEHDPYVPPDIVTTLDGLLGNRPGLKYRSVVHPGVRHGYAIPDRDIFDHAAAEKDWAEIFTMYSRTLG